MHMVYQPKEIHFAMKIMDKTGCHLNMQLMHANLHSVCFRKFWITNCLLAKLEY